MGILKKFKENNLAKVNFSQQRKNPWNVFISLQLTKNDVEFLPIKITSKKVSKNNVHISTIEITLIKVRETTWIFRPSKLHRKKYVETTWIFRPAKLHRKKYVETTWIFRPSKLHREKYVETTWIFRPPKLHRKSTRKWSGNSSKFGLRRIDVISTSNWCWFDVKCPLGTRYRIFQRQRNQLEQLFWIIWY